MSEILLTQEELEKMIKALAAGATPAQVTGISDETLESLYALAHGLYTAGNPKDARVVFQALSLYNPNDYRFWLGLAAARQALEEYEAAVDAYQMAGVATALQNPEPFYHAATCLLQLGRKADAVSALKGLAVMHPEDPAFATVHERARALLSLLEGA